MGHRGDRHVDAGPVHGQVVVDEDRARQGLVGGAGTSVQMIERHYGTLIAGEAVALAGAGSGGNGTATYVVSGALVLGGTLVALPPLLIGLAPLLGPSVGRTEP